MLDYKIKHVVNFDQARSFIYKTNQNIVSQIPHLSPYHISASFSLEESSTSSAETNLVENLSKTIETQQNQITLLISEMEAVRVLLENKSSISETSQTTQTLPENENPMINNDVDLYHETPAYLDDCCENVIPQLPIHQSSPQRESRTVSTDCTNHLSCDDEHSASEA